MEDDYMPPPVLREIAERHPELEWLIYQTPRERRVSAQSASLRFLMREHPTVTDEEWLAILKRS